MTNTDNEFGLREELTYLNNLSLLRTKTANVIWLTSLGTIAGLITFTQSTNNWIFCFIALILLPGFILSISWQLDGIARIRTYIRKVLQPRLGGIWEDKWPTHPIIKNKRRFLLLSVGFIYFWMYSALVLLLLYLAWQCWTDSICIFSLFFSIPILFIIISMFMLFSSFSSKTFEEYNRGWEEIVECI
jgi:hypothetical protein